MMKKSIVFLLVLTMVLSTFLVACAPKDEEVDTPPVETGETPPEEDVEEEPAGPSGQITIGNTTELSGDWIPHWQNNAADYDIYNFMIGTGTVDMTFDGEYLVNETVVEKYEVTENEDGSKTYTWTIKDGLKWDDGSPITAKDYVAYVMLWSSHQIGEMGAGNTEGMRYVGWSEFSKGESKEFKGVNLIDDKTFAVTISSEHLPYYYELPLVSINPEKLSYWTDETVEIKDDGNGCYFSDNFTVEAYEEKINAARFGKYPSSGAYVLKNYDEATKTAVLEINENYAGDYTGQKPRIQTIIYKKVNQETSLDELATGQVDLLSQMSSGDEITAGLDLVDKGGFAYSSYPRAGYGKLVFACDFGPTQFVEVRQAIAHLLDRNDFAKAFTGGFGTVVNGPYGEAQWFYQETKAELNEKLNQYPYSLEKAVELLEEGGWVYDKDGNEYKEGIRHKKLEDGTLMPLVIEWASSEKNAVSELLVVKLQENPDLAKAGIKINQEVMSFPELLNYLQRDGSKDAKYGVPTYGMFNLATGFTPIYDQTRYYSNDPEILKLKTYNTNWIIDDELSDLAKTMVLVDPEDRDGFKEKFVSFIVRWNELLPDIPLYSNIYHDFYNDKLKDFNPNPLVRVDKALLYSYVTE